LTEKYFDMLHKFHLLALLAIIGCSSADKQLKENAIPVLSTGSEKPMPNEWVDEDTGHRIIRLTRGIKGSRSFYFHNNPFFKELDDEGDIMVFYSEVDSLRQLFSVNLKTLEAEQLTYHPNQIRGEILSQISREVFYQSKDSIYATNIDTKSTKLIFVFPEDFKSNITTLNSNATYLAGSHADPEKRTIYKKFPSKGDYFTRIHEAKIKHTLFTINVKTGELNKLYSEKAWLNHVQFSPTDPSILMYDHEGPWHLVDRIWTINIQTNDTQLMHKRTMDMEIAGHEFFSRDGNTIWYDLQLPRGKTFYLARVNIKTGEQAMYAMKRNEWSIHFNISPDQELFAGDGGDSTQVAHATD